MTSSKQDNMDEDDDDDDGPPPGWEFGKLVNALENTTPSPTGCSFYLPFNGFGL